MTSRTTLNTRQISTTETLITDTKNKVNEI